jgi:hypothetical protein
LRTVLLDDAFDAAGTDLEAGLTELLGDDVGRGIGIEEAVTDDLAFDLVGADMVGFGSAFLRLEGQDTILLKSFKELIIPLSCQAVLLGGVGDAEFAAFSLDEHEQPWGDLVALGDEELSSGSGDAAIRKDEVHQRVLGWVRGGGLVLGFRL